MLRDVLERICREYPTARQQPFAGHPLAQYIRGTAAEELKGALGELERGLICEASAGAGNFATVPWLAVFDPVVTTTATQGYYVVYLFAATGDVVHLSLNQGTTAVRAEFAAQASHVLRDRATLIRTRLPEYVAQFSSAPIEMGSRNQLPRDYEAGHAFGLTYHLSEMPSEETLRANLQNLVRAYLVLTFRGGLDPSFESPTTDNIDDREIPPGISLTEVRRYRMHRKIERNSRAAAAAKRHHGTICQACNFDFREKYGELGDGFIEAHHLKPIATLQEGVPVSLDVVTDFAVLCSNCHRMIHRTNNPSDLAAFRAIIRRP